MLNTLLGQKQKMSHTYIEGQRIPVTWVKTGPCIVTQIRTNDRDGYWAVQLGFGEKKLKNISKPLKGHLRGVTKEEKAPRFLREVKLKSEPKFNIGDIVEVKDILKKGDVIAVSGTSKGKGFAGVVKRWGFAGGPRTHGQSDRQRAPGSIGQGTTPGRVLKGKKMGGRMGNTKVTVKNLVVVEVDAEKNEVAVSGAIPGRPGGLLILTKLHAGKLDELVQEAPPVQVVEEEEEGEAKAASEQKPEAAESAESPAKTA
jgi:large subunit ribosomal protein L3